MNSERQRYPGNRSLESLIQSQQAVAPGAFDIQLEPVVARKQLEMRGEAVFDQGVGAGDAAILKPRFSRRENAGTRKGRSPGPGASGLLQVCSEHRTRKLGRRPCKED